MIFSFWQSCLNSEIRLLILSATASAQSWVQRISTEVSFVEKRNTAIAPCISGFMVNPKTLWPNKLAGNFSMIFNLASFIIPVRTDFVRKSAVLEGAQSTRYGA